MNRTLELLWIKIREYFKHPVDDLRQAKVIVPGRVYSNFGHLCKAVPYTRKELDLMNSPKEELPDELRAEAAKWEQVETHCLLCDLQKEGVPCPIYNVLKDGRTVCEVYKYVIIKKARK